MQRIAYARVSKREQALNSHALEQQIDRLKSFGVDEIFVDVESAYKPRYRPQLERVLELVRARAVEEVVITRLDRLSRKGVQSFTIFEDFLQAGVALRALDEPCDLTTAAGKMTAGLLVVVAQHHSDQKAEAVRHGWKHLRNRRVAMNPPFGYIKKNNKHQLDHRPFLCLLSTREERSKAAIAREIIETFFDRKTLRLTLRFINERYGIQIFAHTQNGQQRKGRVARDLFRFSPVGLSNWLTNPVLQGHLSYLRGREYQGRHEIIYDVHPDQKLITAEEARQIEEILSQNRLVRGYGSTALKYPLSGLVFCGECRGACYSTSGRKNYKHPERGYNYYFQCKNWRSRGCSQKTTIRMEGAEEEVIAALTQRAATIHQLANSSSETVEPAELRQLREQLAQLDGIPGFNPAIENAKQDLRSQINRYQLQQQVASHEQEENQGLLLGVFGDSDYWKTLSDSDKREIYRALVKRVVVKEGKVERVELKV